MSSLENEARKRGETHLISHCRILVICILAFVSIVNGKAATISEQTVAEKQVTVPPPTVDPMAALAGQGDWLNMILNTGLVVPSNITSKCKSDVYYFFESLITSKHGGPFARWTLAAIDSYGKLPSGLMEGDMSWLGRFHECTNLQIHKVGNKAVEPDFTGKYCLTFVVIMDRTGKPIPMPIFPKCGMCFPSTCDEEDITKLINMYTPITPIRFAVPKKYCQVKDENLWQPRNTFTVFILCLLGGLVVLGTIQDVSNEWQDELLQKRKPIADEQKGFFRRLEPVLVAFSLPRNMKSIFSVSHTDDRLSCLNGYRFLTTVWVIIVHVFVMGVQDYPWKNILTITISVGNNFWAQAIVAATLSSDSFFLMAGMLVCYNFLLQMKRHNGRFNLPVFYLHRYFRIIPAYALVVLIIGGLLYKLADGPLWPMLQDSTDKCQFYWWKNMLFIQNLWGSFYDQCFLPSWYVAVDFQMYLISPLFLLPLYRNPSYGLKLVWAGLIITMIVPGLLIYAYDMESYTGRHSRAANMDLWTNMIYEKPWNRLSTYFIGILIGYVLHERDMNVRLPRVAVWFGWMACICISCLIVFGPFEYYKGKLMTRNMYALYGAFARPAWASCMGWIIFACVTGHGGIVNTILSWQAFAPLGRLCYCTYLIHLPIVHYIMYSANDGLYVALTTTIISGIGLIVLAFFAGLILSLLTEAPMLQIEKLLLRRYVPSTDDGNGQSSNSRSDTYKYRTAKLVASKSGSNGNCSPINITGNSARRRF